MAKDYRITKDLLDPTFKQEFNDKLDKNGTISWAQITDKPQLADSSWRSPVETVADLPMKDNHNGDLRLVLDVNIVYEWEDDTQTWETIGATGINVEWDGIQQKPSTFPPSVHNHDTLYYKKDYIDTLIGNYYTKTYLNPFLHKHDNKAVLDTITQSMLDKIGTNETDISTLQSTKVDKISGKGLSENDFTDTLKMKLESLGGQASFDYTQMKNALDAHESDTDIHTTQIEKNKWNEVTKKANLDYVNNALASKASVSTVNGHIKNSVIHVTQDDKDKWNNPDMTNIKTSIETDIVSTGISIARGQYRIQQVDMDTTASYRKRVILLMPISVTNSSQNNKIQGTFVVSKTGSNIIDFIDVYAQSVYNRTCASIECKGQFSNHELITCNYQSVKWLALKLNYQPNPYNNIWFNGWSSVFNYEENRLKCLNYENLEGGTSVVTNQEIYDSITHYEPNLIWSYNGKKVFHEGNFNPNNYCTKTALNNHINNHGIHVTQAQKDKWDSARVTLAKTKPIDGSIWIQLI